MSLTDDQLITQARTGDHKAFHALVDRYAPRLYRAAIMMTGNENDAQDLLQETLLASYEGLPRFEGRASLSTWMTGIMMRQASLMRRKSAKRRAMSSLDSPALREQPMAGGHAQARVDARLDLVTLMGMLSAEHREVLVLRELEGMTYEEIARVIEQPRGTVESRLSRARHALRELARSEMNLEADASRLRGGES